MNDRLNEVESILSPHHEVIRECFLDAWKDCQAMLAPNLYRINSSAVANVMNCLVTSNIRARFNEVKGVKIFDRNRMFVMSVGGRVALRYKKLRKNRRPSNVRTMQTRAFMEQEQILPGIPTKHNVIVGYRLSDTNVNIEDILIVRPEKELYDWEYYRIDAPMVDSNIKDISALNKPQGNGASSSEYQFKADIETEKAANNGEDNDDGNK